MIVRRRVRIARGRGSRVGIVLAGLLALGVAWYAGAAVALGLGAAPATIDALTGYRSVVAWLAGPHVPSVATRAIVAAAGLVVFVVLARLALAQVPRPRVPRSPVVLEHAARGTTTVSPRAIERAVECALADFDAVTARWEDGTVTATVDRDAPALAHRRARRGPRRRHPRAAEPRAAGGRGPGRPAPRPSVFDSGGLMKSISSTAALFGFGFGVTWAAWGLGWAALSLLCAALFGVAAAVIGGELDLEDLRERVDAARAPRDARAGRR